MEMSGAVSSEQCGLNLTVVSWLPMPVEELREAEQSQPLLHHQWEKEWASPHLRWAEPSMVGRMNDWCAVCEWRDVCSLTACPIYWDYWDAPEQRKGENKSQQSGNKHTDADLKMTPFSESTVMWTCKVWQEDNEDLTAKGNLKRHCGSHRVHTLLPNCHTHELLMVYSGPLVIKAISLLFP